MRAHGEGEGVERQAAADAGAKIVEGRRVGTSLSCRLLCPRPAGTGEITAPLPQV